VHDEDELPIWIAAARLLPILSIVNADAVDVNTAPFHWARARCLFAGAGHKHHDAIAAVLTDVYPVCDLAPGETEADWITALQKARDICGWPVHLGRLPWHGLVAALGTQEKIDPISPWHLAVGLLHLLKYLRTRQDMLAVVYRGTAALLPRGESNVIALNKTLLPQITQALGCPLPHGKHANTMTIALQLMLKLVSVDRLLSQRPISELPGTVIAGPWSGLEPDPTNSGFMHTGMRLAGVWNACKGAIKLYTGSPVDAIAWAWNVQNPGEFADVRSAVEASMPTTYPTGWPADLLLSDFPNLDLNWATDQECARVLLELPLFASLLRRGGEALSREFPFVLFLPDTPSIDDSTNQGKTAITRTLVRAMSPGAPTVVPPDTSSAPDNRAFVDILSQYGTAGLDEWSPPQNRSHPLSHQNLQTLCTGGGVTFGRVLENTGMITLRHSLVAGCKAVEFPPDMVSRTIMWPLNQFTDAQRNRSDVKARVDSGQAALQLRLAALHQIETRDLANKLANAPPSTNSTLRFDAHTSLACILYLERTGNVCTSLGATVNEMRMRLSRHVADAATTGVLSAQENGGYLTIRLPDLFAGNGPDIVGLCQQEMAAVGVGTERLIGKGWNTAAQLLDSLRKARGFPTLQAMLPAILGGRMKATDRQITIALGRSIKQLVPQGGTFAIPETGWTLERGSDCSNTLRVRLIQPSILVSASGQNDTWQLT
jgi:hypothetical protein